MTTRISLRTYNANPNITSKPTEKPYVDTNVDETVLSDQARAMLAYTNVFGHGYSNIVIRHRATNYELAQRRESRERLVEMLVMYGEEWANRRPVTEVGWWPETYQYHRPNETPEQYLERVVEWLHENEWDVVIPHPDDPLVIS